MDLTVFKELLDNVVSEHINHQNQDRGQDLVEH